MASFGFSLADRLGAKPVACTVTGCSRTWLRMSGKALKLGGRPDANPADPSSSMCDPCRDRFASLSEAARPCDRPGCPGTWTSTVAAQMEAFATKRPPPKNLCAGCEGKLQVLQDKEIPCTVPGCSRTGVFTRRAQLLAGAPDVEVVPEQAMCGPCDQVSRKLQDRPVKCGINGCKQKWTWTADEQIQFFATGKTNEPPRRMCDECKGHFGGIADRDIRCRTSGCRKIWTWARGDQLDACVAGRPAPKAPARMCPSCLDTFSQFKDVERPCRRAGCTRTWTDKRGAQLARAVRGKTGDPYPHYCDECAKELGELDDRAMPCKTDHCEGTWVWSKAQQLAAGVRPPNAPPDRDEIDKPAEGEVAGAAPVSRTQRRKKRRREPRPPERRCEACTEFLTDKKTKEIPCTRCATPIFWPPESQLQTHLGNWAEPAFCGACKRDVMEAARALEREALRHQGMPAVPAEAPAAEAPAEPPPSDQG